MEYIVETLRLVAGNHRRLATTVLHNTQSATSSKPCGTKSWSYTTPPRYGDQFWGCGGPGCRSIDCRHSASAGPRGIGCVATGRHENKFCTTESRHRSTICARRRRIGSSKWQQSRASTQYQHGIALCHYNHPGSYGADKGCQHALATITMAEP